MYSETDLKILLKSMNPVLHKDEFVFCTVSPERFAKLEVDPVCLFREHEGVTMILQRHLADRHNLQYDYTCRMITLTVHSSLHAVGFLAAITGKLAKHGISVNTVSAYYHDYLYVPPEKAQIAMQLLTELSNE